MTKLQTVGDVVKHVRLAVGDQSDVYLTDEAIQSWIQTGYELLVEEVGGDDFYSLQLYSTSFLGDTGTLTAGSQSFNVGNPESDYNVIGLESLLIDGRSVTYREKEDIALSNPGADFDNDTASVPSYYWLEQRPVNYLGLYLTVLEVFVYPRPARDVTWEAKLRATGTKVANGVGSLAYDLAIQMPPPFLRRIVLYCIYKSRIQEKDYRGADMALMEFNASLNNLRDILDRPNDSTPVMIGDPYDRI